MLVGSDGLREQLRQVAHFAKVLPKESILVGIMVHVTPNLAYIFCIIIFLFRFVCLRVCFNLSVFFVFVFSFIKLTIVLRIMHFIQSFQGLSFLV